MAGKRFGHNSFKNQSMFCYTNFDRAGRAWMGSHRDHTYSRRAHPPSASVAERTCSSYLQHKTGYTAMIIVCKEVIWLTCLLYSPFMWHSPASQFMWPYVIKDKVEWAWPRMNPSLVIKMAMTLPMISSDLLLMKKRSSWWIFSLQTLLAIYV